MQRVTSWKISSLAISSCRSVDQGDFASSDVRLTSLQDKRDRDVPLRHLPEGPPRSEYRLDARCSVESGFVARRRPIETRPVSSAKIFGSKGRRGGKPETIGQRDFHGDEEDTNLPADRTEPFFARVEALAISQRLPQVDAN